MPDFFLVSNEDERIGRTKPYFALIKDNWDDFGYKTSFELIYITPSSGFKKVKIGQVKILDADNRITKIAPTFKQLSSNFCSLGQDEDYYVNLNLLGETVLRNVLTALCDSSYNRDIYNKFSGVDGFKTSLLRSSYAEKIIADNSRFWVSRTNQDEGGQIVNTFSIQAELFERRSPAHNLSFHFSGELSGLCRINAIIGKNGTGKTRLLNALAVKLAGINEEVYRHRNVTFLPQRPKFGRIFSTTFSSIDKSSIAEAEFPKNFYRIDLLGDGANTKSIKLADAMHEICNDDKIKRNWLRLKKVICKHDTTDHSDEIFSRISGDVEQVTSLNIDDLSSGQKALLLFVSKLCAYIKDNSLILLDEPETHLHPCYISRLIRIIATLCRDYDSACIISTHSPIIIQCLPKRNVSILKIIDGVPVTVRPQGETFGESLSVITEDVFGLNEESLYYQDILQSGNLNSKESLAKSFPDGLGMHARMVLRDVDGISGDKQ